MAKQMQLARCLIVLTSMLFFYLCVLVFANGAQINKTFTVAGHSGEIPVADIGGRSYIEIEALTRLANATLSFSGNQIIMTLHPSNTHVSTTPTTGFTKEFLRAGIEQMSVIREWRSTLINAVQRGFPITDDWMKTFRDRAQHNLRLVSLAASSESDKNAVQLLTNELTNMQQLSARFVDANKSRIYVPADALDNDPLDRRIQDCGRSLAAMAASGQFVNDGACQ